jgi:N-acetylmuramoyl-L-alanine amidase
LVFFLRVLALKPYSVNAVSWALAGKIIIVDPGHGGRDPGVISPEGIKEKDVNLNIAALLRDLLVQNGVTVIMSRENDSPMSENKREDLNLRANLTAEKQSPLFISIHVNSFPLQPNQCGAQVFYDEKNTEGKILALCIQKRLEEYPLNSKRAALKHKEAFLLKNIKTPAVIVETGFFSNTEEARKLSEGLYQWQMAYKIFSGIADYYLSEQ